MKKRFVFFGLLVSLHVQAARGGYYGTDAGVQGQILHQKDSQFNAVNRNMDNDYVGVGNRGTVLVNPTGGYYSHNCNNIHVCNQDGYCWMQQTCN